MKGISDTDLKTRVVFQGSIWTGEGNDTTLVDREVVKGFEPVSYAPNTESYIITITGEYVKALNHFSSGNPNEIRDP